MLNELRTKLTVLNSEKLTSEILWILLNSVMLNIRCNSSFRPVDVFSR